MLVRMLDNFLADILPHTPDKLHLEAKGAVVVISEITIDGPAPNMPSVSHQAFKPWNGRYIAGVIHGLWMMLQRRG